MSGMYSLGWLSMMLVLDIWQDVTPLHIPKVSLAFFTSFPGRLKRQGLVSVDLLTPDFRLILYTQCRASHLRYHVLVDVCDPIIPAASFRSVRRVEKRCLALKC